LHFINLLPVCVTLACDTHFTLMFSIYTTCQCKLSNSKGWQFQSWKVQNENWNSSKI